MQARRRRSHWWLVVSIFAAIAAVLQAAAVSRASTLLPESWHWANSRSVAWILVAAFTLIVAALTWALSRSRASEALRSDRLRLNLRTDFAFQSGIAVHRPPSTVIRWTPVFDLLYSGTRVLTVHDIVPLPPLLLGDETIEVQLVRTKKSDYYKAFGSYGAMAEASEAEDDLVRYAEEWPLLLRPGQRLRLSVEQEYEMRLDGEPMVLESELHALQMFGAYFQLPPNEDGDGFGIASVLLPTRIVCEDDAWEVDVPYLIMPVGGTVLLPDPDDIDDDELL